MTITGLTNPPTTNPSSSFTISTADSSTYLIETVSSGITVTMTSVSPLTSFTVVPLVLVNGAATSYKISVISTCPMSGSYILKATFPSECTVATTLTCTAS